MKELWTPETQLTEAELELKRKIIVAMRIFKPDDSSVKAWAAREMTTTELHAKALKLRAETQRLYPDAKFQLGDAVRYEQKPCYYHGFISDIDIFKGMFLYTVAFIEGGSPIVYKDGKKPRIREAGEMLRINEAHLHQWYTTPIA